MQVDAYYDTRRKRRDATAAAWIGCCFIALFLIAAIALIIVLLVQTGARNNAPPALVCGSYSNLPADLDDIVVRDCGALSTCEGTECRSRFFADQTDFTVSSPNRFLSCNSPEAAQQCEESGQDSCQCGPQLCERRLELSGVFTITDLIFECVPPGGSIVEDFQNGLFDDLQDGLIALEDELSIVFAPASSGEAASAQQATLREPMDFSTFQIDPDANAGALVELRQSDFARGTVRVRAPCTLVLVEDIEFNPNPEHEFAPTDAQRRSGEYPFNSGFVLGFFAAITIESDNVLLDLNGRELRAGRGWHTMMAFGQLISLGNAPFVTDEGPATFGEEHIAVSNIVIRNGRLGFNQHHAIHGHGARNVYIRDVDCERYHIAGIALNGATNAWLRNVNMLGTNTDLAVLGTFSQANFLRMFLARCAPVDEACAASLARIEQLVQDALADVLRDNSIDAAAHPEAFELFANEERLVDGNVFGLVLTNRGAGVAQFDDEFDPQNAGGNVLVGNVVVRDTRSAVREFVGLVDERNQYVVGPAGDLVAFQKLVERSELDAITEGQFVFASAYERIGRAEGWHVGSLNFPAPLVAWFDDGANLDELGAVIQQNGYRYGANTDAMAHVNKGSTGVRIDSMYTTRFVNTIVDGVAADGAAGFAGLLPGQTEPIDPTSYTNTTGGHPEQESAIGYTGNRARGVLLSASVGVDVSGITVSDVTSRTGDAVNFDTFPYPTVVEQNTFAPHALEQILAAHGD